MRTSALKMVRASFPLKARRVIKAVRRRVMSEDRNSEESQLVSAFRVTWTMLLEHGVNSARQQIVHNAILMLHARQDGS